MNGIAISIFIIYGIIILSLQRIKSVSIRGRCIIRKSVHLATGLSIFLLTYCIDRQSMLILITAGTVFSIATYNIKRINFIHTTSESSLGTLFYPVGLLISFIVLYNMPVCYFRILLMILSVSDTIANLFGEIKTVNRRFTILAEEKSIFGVAGFAVSAFIIHLLLLPEPHSYNLSYILLSVIAAVNFEIISYRGSDNLTIPLGCSLFFAGTMGTFADPLYIIVIILLAAAGSAVLYNKGILTRFGSIGTYLLAIYLFAVLGMTWSIPVIFFFLTSVLFTVLNSKVNKKTSDTNRRNIWQVCANIFFAAVSSALYLITENQVFIYFYITLIATVTSDTWASELGPVFTKKCFSLADREFMDSGISGGISIPGTIASLAGSLIISVLSFYLFFQRIDAPLIAVITLAGFAAAFADSLFSAFLEPKLLKIKFFRHQKGPDALTPNDLVNLSASLTAPAFFLLFRIII